MNVAVRVYNPQHNAVSKNWYIETVDTDCKEWKELINENSVHIIGEDYPIDDKTAFTLANDTRIFYCSIDECRKFGK